MQSDQCKEIEENNRMGKIRDLFKKIRHTKGTFHGKMGTIKDRKSKDLTEAPRAAIISISSSTAAAKRKMSTSSIKSMKQTFYRF